MRLCPTSPSTWLLCAVFAGAPACGGTSFDPASKITGLRVLAVQKDPAYPAPGESVSLKLLYWDGKSSQNGGRDIQICFFGCINPPADLYFNCFAQIAQLRSFPTCTIVNASSGAGGPVDASVGPDAPVASDAGAGPDAGAAGEGPVQLQTFKIPDDIISSRPPPPSGAPYGLAFVLYTVCAGHLGPRAQANANDLPLGCFDDNGQALGPDDFVPGYSTLYVYPDRRNDNPLVNDLLFNGHSTAGSTDLGDDDPSIARVPLCPGADCEIDFRVDVARSSAQIDTGSFGLNGEQLLEQLWVDFYSTRGEFTKPLRLINDATSGWNDDNATKFKVPAGPGPVRLWAVVHDNRGGVAWREGKILVTDQGD
jgi:hypothetical protein